MILWPGTRIAMLHLAAAVLVSAASAEPERDAVSLTLRNGAGTGRDMALDLFLRDGVWSPGVWGNAPAYNFSHHRGRASATTAKDENIRLSVELDVQTDLVAVGGPAAYRIDLHREADRFKGSYTGSFIDAQVTGTVAGRVREPAVRRLAGVRPLEPGEHPRLIFRRHEVPALRQRLETPVGRAIESMLLVRAPLRLASQVTDRRASWMAANWAAIYQLTGDEANAAEAKNVLMEEAILKRMPEDRDDIHHAPRLLGMALAYDLAYPAWEPDFRCYLAEFLLLTAEDLAQGLYEGLPLRAGAVDPTPWRHRNAIRMSCVGLAALAVLGDEDTGGRTMERARDLYDAAERDVVAYLRHGITGAGRGLEGGLSRSLALSNGVLQFMHAARVALGRDLAYVNPFLLAGLAVTLEDPRPEAPRLGLSSISVQASGRWPMGLGSVPREYRAAMAWCYERTCGLQGAGHFDCTYPYHAAYALGNYPFDLQPRSPGEGLPLTILDRGHGEFVFRNRWQDGDDVLAVVNLALEIPAGLDRGAAARIGAVRLSGLGTNWLNGRIGMPFLNQDYEGELLYAERAGAGRAVAGARWDALYERAPRRRRRWAGHSRGGPVVFPPPRRPETQPTGIRCTRHFGVDYSGAAGVPAVFAIVDELGNVEGQRWLFPAGRDRRRPNVLGDPAGRNITWHFLAGEQRGNYVLPAERVIAVATLNDGPAPDVRSTVEGTHTTITVGGAAIHYNGRRISFDAPGRPPPLTGDPDLRDD